MGGTAVPPLPPHALLEITDMPFTTYTNESQSDLLPPCSGNSYNRHLISAIARYAYLVIAQREYLAIAKTA